MATGRFPIDFKLVSGENVLDVSFHMIAVNCDLFRWKVFPEKRFATYLPVPENVLKVFVDCVYDLVVNPDAVKQKITKDNVHYLGLLAEELQCRPLMQLITEFMSAGDENTAHNIEGLAKAVRDQEAEIRAYFEGLLANDIDEALKQAAPTRSSVKGSNPVCPRDCPEMRQRKPRTYQREALMRLHPE